MTRKTNTTKRNTQSRETPSIVLKTIIDDIHRDNKNATITTKKARVKLRATMNDVHVRNASWIFTQSQYDDVRSMFDPAYAQRVAKRAKRDAKSRAKTNATPTVENATTE